MQHHKAGVFNANSLRSKVCLNCKWNDNTKEKNAKCLRATKHDCKQGKNEGAGPRRGRNCAMNYQIQITISFRKIRAAFSQNSTLLANILWHQKGGSSRLQSGFCLHHSWRTFPSFMMILPDRKWQLFPYSLLPFFGEYRVIIFYQI